MANSSIEGRHYAFLAFLTLLNVMNFVDRSCWQASRTSSFRISG